MHVAAASAHHHWEQLNRIQSALDYDRGSNGARQLMNVPAIEDVVHPDLGRSDNKSPTAVRRSGVVLG